MPSRRSRPCTCSRPRALSSVPKQVPRRCRLRRAHAAERHAGPAARHIVPVLAPDGPGKLPLAALALIEKREPGARSAAHLLSCFRRCRPGEAGERQRKAERRGAAQQAAPARVLMTTIMVVIVQRQLLGSAGPAKVPQMWTLCGKPTRCRATSLEVQARSATLDAGHWPLVIETIARKSALPASQRFAVRQTYTEAVLSPSSRRRGSNRRPRPLGGVLRLRSDDRRDERGHEHAVAGGYPAATLSRNPAKERASRSPPASQLINQREP